MAKSGAIGRRMNGFKLFEQRINEAIDYCNNRGPRPTGVCKEEAKALKKNHSEGMAPKATTITSGGERVWSF